MKLLLIGDPHLKITKLDLAKQFLQWINLVIAEQKPDMVVNLGDTFDGHANLRSEILSEFRKHIDVVHDLHIPYYYVCGNHDAYKPNDNTYHALQCFKGLYDDLYIIDKPLITNGIAFIPYVPDHTKFPTELAEITIAHQSFVGCDYGSYRPEVAVDSDTLDTRMIISGHIHKKQAFGKVIYPGSPYSASVNDIDQHKSIMLFNTDTYQQTYIPSPFPMWRSVRYRIDKINNINTLHGILDQSLNDSDHWTIDVEGPKQEITAYFKTKEYLKLAKGKHISIKMRPTDKVKKNKVIRSVTIESIVSDYIDTIYDGQLDRVALKAKALQIISK